MTPPQPDSDAPEIEDWAGAIRAGERRALARAITLVESTRADDRARARKLLALLHGAGDESLRIGLTGAPGVGKSTFIEAFGMQITKSGEPVAVLAVDPSSRRSGGSVLGDKTRMEKLSRDPNAFIRPSPAAETLGGVARRTREVITLVEAAGFSTVLVETVGVGQSEVLVADMTDVFVLLTAPGGGDELQGVKRGVVEMADLLLVTKADGELKAQAERTAGEYASALRLLRRRSEDPDWAPLATTISAMRNIGLDETWTRIRDLDSWRREAGWRDRRRREQAMRWLRHEIERGLITAFEDDLSAQAAFRRLESEVASGEIAPEIAADQALQAFRSGKGS